MGMRRHMWGTRTRVPAFEGVSNGGVGRDEVGKGALKALGTLDAPQRNLDSEQ